MNLLIVEDDIDLANGLNIFFKNKYDIKIANSLNDARTLLEKEFFNIMILDLNLPDGDGLDFCEECKKKYNIGIIILTARDLEEDEISGLTLGADDYITKPFRLPILQVRLEAVAKRYENIENPNKKYLFDFDKQIFKVHGTEITLTSTEQKLLQLFVENKGKVLTKEIMMDRIWYDYEDDNIISVTLNRLRKKVGTDAIENHYGVGYSWVG